MNGTAKDRDDSLGVVGGPGAFPAPAGVDDAVKPVVSVLMTQEQHSRAVESVVPDKDPIALEPSVERSFSLELRGTVDGVADAAEADGPKFAADAGATVEIAVGERRERTQATVPDRHP